MMFSLCLWLRNSETLVGLIQPVELDIFPLYCNFKEKLAITLM